MKRLQTSLLFLLMTVLVVCTTERSYLDKTNQTALDKRMFEGEYLYKQTIVDLPYTADFTFKGETNDAKIIRFEITENYLIAYNIHDKVEVENTEGELATARPPVFAFPIRDHFDIIPQENSQTGEKLPYLIENKDRPWWQRQYFVVDFSTPAITNFELIYLNMTIDWENPFTRQTAGGYFDMEFYTQGLDIYDDIPVDPRNFDPDNAPISTFNFKTQDIISANNDWYDVWSWADVEEYINYEPMRITYRHYFWKVDRDATDPESSVGGFVKNNNFQTIEMTEPMFRKFGYFTTLKRFYDKIEGYKDEYRHEYANYFHTKPGVRNGEKGSKNVVYLSPNYPERLEVVSCSVAKDFNYSFKRAYHALTNPNSQVTAYPEQRETPEEYVNYLVTDPSDIERENAKCFDRTPCIEDDECADGKHCYLSYCEKTDDLYVLRRNEMLLWSEMRDSYDLDGNKNAVLIDGVEYACLMGLDKKCIIHSDGTKRPRWKHELGDIRKSFIFWINEPTEYGILGVAQWSADPETGQILSAVAHNQGSVLQRVLERAMNIYDYLTGELGMDALIHPSYEQYPEIITPTMQQTNRRALTTQEKIDVGKNRMLELSKRGNINALVGTKYEKMMVPSAVVDFNYPGQTNTDMSPNMLKGLSPADIMTVEGMKKKIFREIEKSKRCYIQEEFLDGATLKFILDNRESGKTREQIWYEMEKITYKSLAEHEYGHGIGLRHNFKGSIDELNFVGPQKGENNFSWGYWYEKQDYDTKMAAYDGEHPTATGRERFDYGKTIPNYKNYFAYSSMMDYLNRLEYYDGSFGLGKYDLAAVKFIYGRTVEKYDVVDENGNPLEMGYAGQKALINKRYVGDDGKLVEEPKVEIKAMTGGSYKKTVVYEKDQLGQYKTDENGQKINLQVYPFDNDDIHPYKFCSDEKVWEDADCQWFDQGVTAAEIVRNQIDFFNQYYYFGYFRRGNPRFRKSDWWASIMQYWKLAHWALDFNWNIFKSPDWQQKWISGDQKFNEDMENAIQGIEKDLTPFQAGDYMIASMEAFNFILYDIIYRPNVEWYLDLPDTYYRNRRTYVENPYILDGESLKTYKDYGYFEDITGIFQTDIRYGRYHRNFWDIQEFPEIYYEKLMRRGFTADKYAGMFLLTNSGWWIEKYWRENMANSFSIMSAGFENAIYQMLSDISTEGRMTSFSSYCASEKVDGVDDYTAKSRYVLKKQPAINSTILYNSPWSFTTYQGFFVPPQNFCSQSVPMHPSWIYFDKGTPILWALVNIPNQSADNNIYQYFVPQDIAVSQYEFFEPLKPNQIEFLNLSETIYWRATASKFKNKAPVYEVVKEANEYAELYRNAYCVGDGGAAVYQDPNVNMADLIGQYTEAQQQEILANYSIDSQGRVNCQKRANYYCGDTILKTLPDDPTEAETVLGYKPVSGYKSASTCKKMTPTSRWCTIRVQLKNGTYSDYPDDRYICTEIGDTIESIGKSGCEILTADVVGPNTGTVLCREIEENLDWQLNVMETTLIQFRDFTNFWSSLYPYWYLD